MPYSQLIYCSQPFGLDDFTLGSILTSARHHNERNGVTGSLICRGDLFLQMLEGEAEVVQSTYARILRDPRHVDAKRLYVGEAAERLFAGWSMRQDPMRSWMWSREEVAAGAARRATPEEALGVFQRAWPPRYRSRLLPPRTPEPALIIATWNVNSVRQRLPPPARLPEGGRARRDLPAGDQVPGRGVPARGDRGARLQRRDARAEDLQRRRHPVEASAGGRARPARRRERRAIALSRSRHPLGLARAAAGEPLSAQRQSRSEPRNTTTSSPSWTGSSATRANCSPTRSRSSSPAITT